MVEQIKKFIASKAVGKHPNLKSLFENKDLQCRASVREWKKDGGKTASTSVLFFYSHGYFFKSFWIGYEQLELKVHDLGISANDVNRSQCWKWYDIN